MGVAADNADSEVRQPTVDTDRAHRRKVLIVVENLPVPFDRRVWQEALALREAGYGVSVICPKGKGHDSAYEVIDGIHIYRHGLPVEASGPLGYLAEYSVALFWEFVLSIKVRRRHGFTVFQACNPPDLIFLVALYHKLFHGVKFVFDQHDINPELYEVKFKRRDVFYKILRLCERLTFKTADQCIATNETLRLLAIERGGISPDRVCIVKSFPDLSHWPSVNPDISARREFRHVVGYLGIMADQDGVDLLVEAMDRIVNRMKRSDTGCLIIGDGPELGRLKALARERGLENHVTFCGFLRGGELVSKLSACDVGVIPDPPNACNHKLSMNKVFEYMTLGLPFVQFDLEQARKEAGEASLIVPEATSEALAKSIALLLDDAPRRRRMSVYGRQRAAWAFNWANERRSLLTAYESLFPSEAEGAVTPRVGTI